MSLSVSSESDGSTISFFSETQSEAGSFIAVKNFDPKDEFPNCPFNLDCFNDVTLLDYKFTDEKFILIYDDRLNTLQPNFSQMTELEKYPWRHYTMVECVNDDPITLRQIIEKMISKDHYSSDKVQEHFGHYYLEKFEQRSQKIWEVCWGK